MAVFKRAGAPVLERRPTNPAPYRPEPAGLVEAERLAAELRGRADALAERRGGIVEQRAAAERKRAGAQDVLARAEAEHRALDQARRDAQTLSELGLTPDTAPDPERLAAVAERVAGLQGELARIDAAIGDLDRQASSLEAEEAALRARAAGAVDSVLERERAELWRQFQAALRATYRAALACGDFNREHGLLEAHLPYRRSQVVPPLSLDADSLPNLGSAFQAPNRASILYLVEWAAGGGDEHDAA